MMMMNRVKSIPTKNSQWTLWIGEFMSY